MTTTCTTLSRRIRIKKGRLPWAFRHQHEEVCKFAMSELTTQQHRIVSGAQNATWILSTGSAVAVMVVAAKLLSSRFLHVSGLVIAVGSAWILFVILTAANIFVAIFLALRIDAYLTGLPSERDLQQTFDKVTSGRNPFVHGLLSRANPRRPGGIYHPMRLSDPSAWIAYAAVALLVAALLPWRLTTSGVHWEKGFAFWALIILTVLIAVLNWWAGGIWMIQISRLSDLAAYVDALPDGPVTNEDLGTLVGLAGPVVHGDNAPNHRYYEVANFLNRLTLNPDAFVPKPVFGIRRRRQYRYDFSNESVWREITYIYAYFRSNLPQLIVRKDPWFLSVDHWKASTKEARSTISREKRKEEKKKPRERGFWSNLS
jgi:hypothetical protein